MNDGFASSDIMTTRSPDLHHPPIVCLDRRQHAPVGKRVHGIQQRVRQRPSAFYLPITVVSIVRNKEGLPIGVQIVARSHGDRTTIAVAAMIELLNGSFTTPPDWN
jgi:Asp-tRNA(Asn)/Glu-tRNA(Gln) amidotransferase A subunit family amidase